MNSFSIVIPLIVLVLQVGTISTSAQAQQTLAELKAQIDAGSSELDEIDELLSDPDPNRRAAAMNALMASNNPAFVNRAIEAGLYSADPRMRSTALKRILDSGGPFTLEVDLTDKDEKETFIREWLQKYGDGTWNEETGKGRSIFRSVEYSDDLKCWPFKDSNACAFVQDGERISLQGWNYAAGELTLTEDGSLKGTFQYNWNGKGVPLPAEIRLLE